MIKPEVLQEELNKLFKTNMDEYKKECDYWKSKGYKIYRNTQGVHKVVINQKEATKSAMIDIFGSDIFGDIFGGFNR